uniref:Uncharacterized protein n=1 Tax=Plectus sambesii TaxID=2011161 RepID=A0A914VWD8_9BILA
MAAPTQPESANASSKETATVAPHHAKAKQQRSNSLSTIVKMRLSSATSKLLHRISLPADNDDNDEKGWSTSARDNNASEYRKWMEKRRSMFTTPTEVEEGDRLQRSMHRKQAVDNSLVQENIAAVASSMRVQELC